MSFGPPVLVLRPEPGNARTCAALAAAGLDARALPLFEIAPQAWQLPKSSEFDALLFTSANAVHHGGSDLADLVKMPVWCVGQATAAAASDSGFVVAGVGNHGIDDLLASIPEPTRLLWLCGEDRTSVVAPSQIAITPVPVYAAQAIPLGPRAIPAPSIALLYSVRGAQVFAGIATNRSAITLVTLSASVAAAAGLGWRDVQIAAQPRDTEMVAIALRLCQNN